MSDGWSWRADWNGTLPALFGEHGPAAVFACIEDAQQAADALNGVLRDQEVQRLTAELCKSSEHYADLHTAMQQVIDIQRERYEIAELELSLLRKAGR